MPDGQSVQQLREEPRATAAHRSTLCALTPPYALRPCGRCALKARLRDAKESARNGAGRGAQEGLYSGAGRGGAVERVAPRGARSQITRPRGSGPELPSRAVPRPRPCGLAWHCLTRPRKASVGLAIARGRSNPQSATPKRQHGGSPPKPGPRPDPSLYWRGPSPSWKPCRWAMVAWLSEQHPL